MKPSFRSSPAEDEPPTFALRPHPFALPVKPEADRYTKLRQEMVQEQIVVRGIRDRRVLDAMRTVPRHLFVKGDATRSSVPLMGTPLGVVSPCEAYNDYPLPIGQGQTISQPFIVARMTELLGLKGDERVLEIGTGSGYQAAVLSLLAHEVYTIEIIEPLANAAIELLKRLRYDNVHVRCGDGYLGWTEAAPFDGILVTAAAPRVPDSLVAQLKDGGRLVIPVGEEHETQILTLFRKKGDMLVSSEVEPVRFVPMRGRIEKA
jgi:protein-L-isoaspartate(D-aspartate) O-methyltransferase